MIRCKTSLQRFRSLKSNNIFFTITSRYFLKGLLEEITHVFYFLFYDISPVMINKIYHISGNFVYHISGSEATIRDLGW